MLAYASEPRFSVAFRLIFPGGSLNADMTPSRVNNTATEIIVRVLDEEGGVFEEIVGIGMQF